MLNNVRRSPPARMLNNVRRSPPNVLCTLYWISTFLIILFCADVECQDSTFIIGNRAIYTCSLTITDFDEIVIAKLSDTSLTLATISNNGTITYMIQIDATITYVAGEKVEFTISRHLHKIKLLKM
jgi:hypothetical protein